MLKIMDSEIKVATASNYAFSKSSGAWCNGVKNYFLSQFEDEGAQGSSSENQADKMNEWFRWESVLIHCADGHAGKMCRTN